jgi:glycosyltransferase involved in cell wall biosynthesis
MTSARPSVGIYGPYGHDKSGVARYIKDSIRCLEEEYHVTVISNSSGWIDPHSFDATLYHLGNNLMHHTAFKAARLRPGVTLIHEYLHLDYYYQARDLVPPALQADILASLTAATEVQAATLDGFLDCCEQSGTIDPYAIDIGVEKHTVHSCAVIVVHSQGVADMLKARYPGAVVKVIPFPVEPWPSRPDQSHLRYYGIPEGTFTFGTFGFIGEYKQVPWILAAWRQWHDRPSGARLLLVGERQIEVDADAEEFTRLLASVDCGIQLRQPSLGETSGPTASLAAHGRPLILSDIPEMRLLDRGARTMFVRSGDDVIENLTAAMRTQYELGPAPHSGFDARFSWDGWTGVMLKILATGR